MSFGLDPIGVPENRPAQPPATEHSAPDPTLARAERGSAGSIPISSTFARQEFLDVTPTSVVREELVLAKLHSNVNALFEHLQHPPTSEEFHSAVGTPARELIEAAIGQFVVEGTDFPTAVAVLKSWTRPFFADFDRLKRTSPEIPVSLEERIRAINQKTLFSAVQHLERIHAVLDVDGISPMQQRARIVQEFGAQSDSARDVSSVDLLKKAVLAASCDLARRTLDVSVLLKTLHSPLLRQQSLTGLRDFAAESDIGNALFPLTPPYPDLKTMRAVRRECMQALWGACENLIRACSTDSRADARSGARLKHSEEFSLYFGVLAQFNGQAMPYFHRCLSMAVPSREPGPVPPLLMVMWTYRYLLDTGAKLGPSFFAPLLHFPQQPLDPVAAGSAAEQELSSLEADPAPGELVGKDVIDAVLRLSSHPSSPQIREISLKCLKALAYRLTPESSPPPNAVFIRDDRPGFLREYDPRVLLKFQRLDAQLDALSPEVRSCVLSMKPLEQVLPLATNDSGRVADTVQIDALGDLKGKLEVLSRRLPSATEAQKTELLGVFRTVLQKLSRQLPGLPTPISDLRIDLLGLAQKVLR
ncbi:MAG: hypothetical protein J0M12_02440 [Deltaproteobacteria bacterium]|nr:hypothetical protein [Deltaproteobacteria bacterium]